MGRISLFGAVRQQPEFLFRVRCLGAIRNNIDEPFLRQQNARAIQARNFGVFLAINQSHSWIQPHQRHAKVRQAP
ncbi:hypothetical protein D9M68_444300 [compost metagenome]